MTSTNKDPILVVVQLTGGNDYMNTVIPYENPLYYDNRTTVGIAQEDMLPIDQGLALNPALTGIKNLYDQGKVALINGVGYPTPNRSHFRSMDIWHTCEPEAIGTEGWLGRATKQLDPNSDNVLTAVNFGRGLPRALVMDGVPVASVGNLETYGLLTGIEGENQRNDALDVFGRMYAPAVGTGAVMDYIHQTGTDALKGADILSTAPDKYSSSVEYSPTAIGQYMKNIAQTHFAGFGTRVLYTTSPYNGFDSHANQAQANAGLLTDVSNTVDNFMTDLREHDASDEVTLLLFSEFGRRVIDNGSGTDHGAAGVAFAVGEHVKGGIYGTYPSLEPSQLEEGGNLKFNLDFRSVYSTILEDWFQLDAEPIVNGNFERTKFFA